MLLPFSSSSRVVTTWLHIFSFYEADHKTLDPSAAAPATSEFLEPNVAPTSLKVCPALIYSLRKQVEPCDDLATQPECHPAFAHR